MTEKGAVIEVQLGIKGHDIVIPGKHHGVDFSQGAILAYKGIVKAAHEFLGGAHSLFGQAQLVSHAAGLEGQQAHCRVDGLLENLLRGFGGYLLDFHAALSGSHHHHPGCVAVNDEGKIVFFLDICTGFDKKTVNLLAFGAGLVGHQHLAQNFAGVGLHLIQRLGHLHAASLATATSMDLGFHHAHGGAQLLGILHRFFYRKSRESFRHLHAVGFQDLLALILMDIHVALPPLWVTPGWDFISVYPNS